MKRPVMLIVGAAAGALLIAGIGASAHSGLSLPKLVGVQSVLFGDEASGARTEPTETPDLPEPTDTPEAPPTAQPAQTQDNDADDNEAADNEAETDDDAGVPAATNQQSGDHETSDDNGGGGDD